MSELDNLYSRRLRYRSKKESCERERRTISRKIERLEQAKIRVAAVKEDADEARTYIKNKLETHADEWVGSVYNKVNSIHQDGINPKYNNYYNDVDFILDEICDEITRLENENRNLGFVLNGIVNTLKSIANEIEKWLN